MVRFSPAWVLAAAVALPAAWGSAAHATPTTNLVTNGSFETTTVTGKTTFATKSGNSLVSNVTGWSIGTTPNGSNSLTFIDFPGTADDGSYLSVYKGLAATSPDGGNFVEADGDPTYSAAISQSISGLTVGQSYLLQFYQAAGQQTGFTGPTTEQWQVTFGGVSQTSPQYSLASKGVGAWQLVTMYFTATSTTQTLSFLAQGTPNGAPPISFLDGVTLTAAVPEPASLALLGMGLTGMAAMRRRKASAKA